MRNYVVFALFIALAGCATTPVERAPSEYLLATDKDIAKALKDVRTELEKNKYAIKKEDLNSGILITIPRKFFYEEDGKKKSAYQTLQFRQEGGSVKIRIVYKCNYGEELDSIEPCHKDDTALRSKISRLEPLLIKAIQPALLKYGEKNEK